MKQMDKIATSNNTWIDHLECDAKQLHLGEIGHAHPAARVGLIVDDESEEGQHERLRDEREVDALDSSVKGDVAEAAAAAVGKRIANGMATQMLMSGAIQEGTASNRQYAMKSGRAMFGPATNGMPRPVRLTAT